MTNELKIRISNHLSDAGYSMSQITAGIAYADKVGYDGHDEALSLVVSRILYGDAALEDGARFGVEAGSW